MPPASRDFLNSRALRTFTESLCTLMVHEAAKLIRKTLFGPQILYAFAEAPQTDGVSTRTAGPGVSRIPPALARSRSDFASPAGGRTSKRTSGLPGMVRRGRRLLATVPPSWGAAGGGQAAQGQDRLGVGKLLEPCRSR